MEQQLTITEIEEVPTKRKAGRPVGAKTGEMSIKVDTDTAKRLRRIQKELEATLGFNVPMYQVLRHLIHKASEGSQAK